MGFCKIELQRFETARILVFEVTDSCEVMGHLPTNLIASSVSRKCRLSSSHGAMRQGVGGMPPPAEEGSRGMFPGRYWHFECLQCSFQTI